MKCLITYYSRTGNTRKVAEAIREVIPSECPLINMEEMDRAEGYDLIFAGFSVMQFGPAKEATQFLSRLPAGQKLAIFVTHSMDPVSSNPELNKTLEVILEKCRRTAGEASLIGFFHCRVELNKYAAEMLKGSGIPLLQQFATMRGETLGHPDEADLEAARNFASLVLRKQ